MGLWRKAGTGAGSAGRGAPSDDPTATLPAVQSGPPALTDLAPVPELADITHAPRRALAVSPLLLAGGLGAAMLAAGLLLVAAFGTGSFPGARADAAAMLEAPTASSAESVPEVPGVDPELDSLHLECAAGNMLSCRMLGEVAPANSDYEEFAATCGGTVPARSGEQPGVFCWMPAGDSRGSDPILDDLWDSCSAGVMRACNELSFGATERSEYWLFGATCGGALPEATPGECVSPR